MPLPPSPKVLSIAQLAAAGVEKKFHFADGLVAIGFSMPKGSRLGTHAHNYGHLSVLARGRVQVKVDGDVLNVVAPNCLNIRQGMEHEIIALDDSYWYCIHASDVADPDTVEDTLVKPK